MPAIKMSSKHNQFLLQCRISTWNFSNNIISFEVIRIKFCFYLYIQRYRHSGFDKALDP